MTSVVNTAVNLTYHSAVSYLPYLTEYLNVTISMATQKQFIGQVARNLYCFGRIPQGSFKSYLWVTNSFIERSGKMRNMKWCMSSNIVLCV